MATFRKRGTRWQAQVRLKGHAPLSQSFKSKAEAEQWARQIEAKVDQGETICPRAQLAEIKLDDLLAKYVTVVTPTKKGAAPEGYRIKTLRAHSIAQLPLDKLNSAAVASYRDERLQAVSPSSVLRELAILQHCLHLAAVDWGIPLKGNPVADIKKPKQAPSRQRRISADELQALKDALATRSNQLIANVIHFAIHTGMRRREILAFRWCDINVQERTVLLADTKNGHPRTVPLSPAAMQSLPTRSHNNRDTDRVFPMSANAVRLSWERLDIAP